MLLQVTDIPATKDPIVLYVWIITTTVAIIIVLATVLRFLYKKLEEKNADLINTHKVDTDRYIAHTEKVTTFLTTHTEKITQAVDDNSKATEGLTSYIKTRDDTLRHILDALKK